MSKDKKTGQLVIRLKTRPDRIFYTVNMIIWIIILVIVIYPICGHDFIRIRSVRGKSRRSAVCPGGFFLGGV